MVYKIIRESIRVLLLTAVLSSIGGFAISSVSEKLFVILPLLIMLPALNDMLGDYSMIIVGKFTTYLSLKKIKGNWRKSHILKHLLAVIVPSVILSAIYLTVVAVGISSLRGFSVDYTLFLKLLSVVLITALALVILTYFIAVIGGRYVHKKKEDPDTLLIPITTAVADFGGMLLFSLLVYLIF